MFSLHWSSTQLRKTLESGSPGGHNAGHWKAVFQESAPVLPPLPVREAKPLEKALDDGAELDPELTEETAQTTTDAVTESAIETNA